VFAAVGAAVYEEKKASEEFGDMKFPVVDGL
jgi:hypothetical protein